jgi:hypothetical protein
VKHLIRGRQTPALVVAILALVAAVTGVAIGSPGAHSSAAAMTKKKVKKIAKNVADQEITKLAPTLSVKSAQTAATADRLSMFAQVTAGGSIIGSSLGVGSVSHPTQGIYCFSGLARQPIGGEATADFNDPATATDQYAQFGLGRDISGFCPTGTQAMVGTFAINGTGGADLHNAGFFVEMW